MALEAWSRGEKGAEDVLISLVYSELRGMARGFLRRERAGHTLQTTDLVHEAYMRLVDQRRVDWQSRNHFFAIAARVMRRVLVDYARSRKRHKRLGDVKLIPLQDASDVGDSTATEVVALNDALRALAEFDPQKAAIVELRYFGGFTTHEAAEILGISEATIGRHWRLAKAWLYREFAGGSTRDG